MDTYQLEAQRHERPSEAPLSAESNGPSLLASDTSPPSDHSMALSWRERKKKVEENKTFVVSLFAGMEVDFELGDGISTCTIGRRLKEEKDHRGEKNVEPPFDVTGVFECSLNSGTDCKIYMQ